MAASANGQRLRAWCIRASRVTRLAVDASWVAPLASPAHATAGRRVGWRLAKVLIARSNVSLERSIASRAAFARRSTSRSSTGPLVMRL